MYHNMDSAQQTENGAQCGKALQCFPTRGKGTDLLIILKGKAPVTYHFFCRGISGYESISSFFWTQYYRFTVNIASSPFDAGVLWLQMTGLTNKEDWEPLLHCTVYICNMNHHTVRVSQSPTHWNAVLITANRKVKMTGQHAFWVQPNMTQTLSTFSLIFLSTHIFLHQFEKIDLSTQPFGQKCWLFYIFFWVTISHATSFPVYTHLHLHSGFRKIKLIIINVLGQEAQIQRNIWVFKNINLSVNRALKIRG